MAPSSEQWVGVGGMVRISLQKGEEYHQWKLVKTWKLQSAYIIFSAETLEFEHEYLS